MERIGKRMVPFIIVFTIMSMFTTSLLSNAASTDLESFSSNYSTNSMQTLQGDDGYSLFKVGRSGTQTYMTFQNQTSTNNYVVLTVSAISSSSTIMNTNSYIRSALYGY